MAGLLRSGLLRAMALLAPMMTGTAWAQAAAPSPGRQVFDMFDLNHDGRVTWDEAWASLQRRFALADTNHDGGLSLEEWLAADLPGRPPRPNRPAPDAQRQLDRRMAMFRAIDANRDNQVTLEEVRPVAEAWHRAFDANADGAVTPEEMPRIARPATPAGR